MREIKFRYWNDQAKKYHYGQEQVLACLSQQITGLYNHEADGCRFEQYTGLHDKNGREIYEGDKVKDAYDNYGAVYWEGTGFVILDHSGAIDSGTPWEVIGNIHENPELLA